MLALSDVALTCVLFVSHRCGSELAEVFGVLVDAFDGDVLCVLGDGFVGVVPVVDGGWPHGLVAVALFFA